MSTNANAGAGSDAAYALEAAIGRLLVAGTWLAMGLVAVGVVLMLATGRIPILAALVILARDLLLVVGYRVLAPTGFELEVTLLGKVATWVLYAALGLVLVTPEGTAWPIVILWIGVALSLGAGVPCPPRTCRGTMVNPAVSAAALPRKVRRATALSDLLPLPSGALMGGTSFGPIVLHRDGVRTGCACGRPGPSFGDGSQHGGAARAGRPPGCGGPPPRSLRRRRRA